jgi:hypothetical protein
MKSLIEVIRLFSDPEAFRSLTETGVLLDQGYPAPWRLALWLEYFLRAGRERFWEKWTRLSPEGQNDLGVEILKCYLFQPLFVPLSTGESLSPARSLPGLKKKGQLLQADLESTEGRSERLFYPLAHHRLWPGLWDFIKEEFPPSPKVFKRLIPDLTLASSSRLEKVRQRAESLISFFSTGQEAVAGPGLVPEEKAPRPVPQTGPVITAFALRGKKKPAGRAKDQMDLFGTKTD